MARLRSFASLRMTVLVGFAVVLSPRVAVAQVGNPPGDSPFRDIRKGHTLTATGGYFGGGGGKYGVGPHNGPVFGGRYDIRTGSSIQLGLSIAHGSLDRFIVDSFVQLVNRTGGPVEQSVTFADITIQFNVTGGKSWNRIAPFAAAVVGLAFAGDTPGDTTGYDFGNEFYVAPSAGFRFFISDRLHLRGEARAVFWKLNYPTILQGDFSEWTTSPWLQAGLGYSFSP